MMGMGGMGGGQGGAGHMQRCPLCGGTGAVTPEQAAEVAPAPPEGGGALPAQALASAMGGMKGGMGGGHRRHGG